MKELIENGYKLLEDDKLTQAVSVCLRIARKNKDYINIAIFLKELSTDKRISYETFINDTNHFDKDVQKQLFDFGLERWLNERNPSYSTQKDDNQKCYIKSVGELIADIKDLEDSINDFNTPSGMTPIDTAYYEIENQNKKVNARNYLGELYTIKERIRARCINYLITIERQIESQKKADTIQYDFINEVNNYYKELDKNIYDKLLKTLELLKNSDDESNSLLLTEVRRTIKAVADYHYPPVDNEAICSDGQKRLLGENEYLNRLEEFINTSVKKSISKELLLLEFDNLNKIIKKLNKLSSKGVHSSVSKREAKQCFISFYNFLSNIIMVIQEK